MIKAFGTDWSGLPDMEPGKLVSGLKNLTQALLRRSITPAGALFYDVEYGFDLREYLLEEDSELVRYEITSLLSRQYELDPRVLTADVEIEFVEDVLNGRTIKIKSLIETEQGTVDLITAIDKVSAKILNEGMTAVESLDGNTI